MARALSPGVTTPRARRSDCFPSYYFNSIHITRFNRFAFFWRRACRGYGLSPSTLVLLAAPLLTALSLRCVARHLLCWSSPSRSGALAITATLPAVFAPPTGREACRCVPFRLVCDQDDDQAWGRESGRAVLAGGHLSFHLVRGVGSLEPPVLRS